MRRFRVSVFALLVGLGGGAVAYFAFSDGNVVTPSIPQLRLAVAQATSTPKPTSKSDSRRSRERDIARVEKKLTHAAANQHRVARKAGNAPDVLRATCSDQRMKVESTIVQAQRDGVHIAINPAWEFVVLNDAGSPFSTFSGPNPIVFPIPPGPIYATCTTGRSGYEGFKPGGRLIYIVDPHGYWIDDRLTCDAVDAKVHRFSESGSDPEDAVRKGVRGVLPSDDVLRSEYRGYHTGYVWVVVRRDGENIARFTVTRERNGVWYAWYGYACSGSGIGGA